MIELKMKDDPEDTCAELKRMAWLSPTKAAETLDVTKSRMVIRSVGIPALRAETRSPPRARIQLPHGEKCRTKA